MATQPAYVAHCLDEGVSLRHIVVQGSDWFACGTRVKPGGEHQPIFLQSGFVNELPLPVNYYGGGVRSILPTFQGVGTCWQRTSPQNPNEMRCAVWDDVRKADPPRIITIPGVARGQLLFRIDDRILGMTRTTTGTEEVFVTDPGGRQVQFIGHLGGNMSQGGALTKFGEVGGSSRLADGRLHPVRWHQTGGLKDLLPAAQYGLVFGGNDLSELVGVTNFVPDINHGVLFDSRDQPTDLPPLSLAGHMYSLAYSLNCSAQIVGQSHKRHDQGHDPRAVIWLDHKPLDLNGCIASWATNSPVPLNSASWITEEGVILCSSDKLNRRSRSVVLLPKI